MNYKVKSLFFSQYLGQKVLILDSYNPHILSVIPCDLSGVILLNGALLLRDISQLAIPESINVYKLRDIARDGNSDKEDCSYIKHQITLWCKYGQLDYLNYQYLTRIGILLPFTYLSETNQPINLTSAEIIALGWAKLQSNEQ